jgi:hypothetical protein
MVFGLCSRMMTCLMKIFVAADAVGRAPEGEKSGVRPPASRPSFPNLKLLGRQFFLKKHFIINARAPPNHPAEVRG